MSNVLKFRTREEARAAATATQVVVTIYNREKEVIEVHIMDAGPLSLLSVTRHEDGIMAPLRSDKYPDPIGYIRTERAACVPHRDVTIEEFREVARKPVKVFDRIHASADTAHVEPEDESEKAPKDLTCPDTVRQFLEIINAQAKRAISDAGQPGVLQMSRLHPSKETLVPSRFKIGDIDGMVKVALADAKNQHNVYLEGRTVRVDLKGSKRGSAADTAWVFALTTNSDDDKGKAAAVILQPSLVVEFRRSRQYASLVLP